MAISHEDANAMIRDAQIRTVANKITKAIIDNNLTNAEAIVMLSSILATMGGRMARAERRRTAEKERDKE